MVDRVRAQKEEIRTAICSMIDLKVEAINHLLYQKSGHDLIQISI